MSNPSGIPNYATPFLNDDGNINEVWYRYLRRIGNSSSQALASITIETPGGAMNGANVTFTLENLVQDSPDLPWIILLLNGVAQQNGTDFTVSGQVITFTIPPKATDYSLVALYIIEI